MSEPIQGRSSSSGCWKYVVSGCVLLLVLGAGVVLSVGYWGPALLEKAKGAVAGVTTESLPYGEAMKRVEQDPFVIERLGAPLTGDFPLPFNVNKAIVQTYYTMSFAIHGPKGQGSVDLTAGVVGETVTFDRLQVWVGTEGRDLLAAEVAPDEPLIKAPPQVP